MAVRVCRQVKKRAVRFFDSLATFSSHFSFFFFPLSLRWSFFLASRIKLCNWEKFNSRRFSIWVKECFSELFLDIVLYCVQTSISCVSKCKLVCVVCASCLNAAHWSRWHVYSCAYSSLSFSFVLVEETLGRRLFDYSSKERKKKKSNISEHYSLSRSNEPYASTKTSKTRTKGIVDGNSAMKHG